MKCLLLLLLTITFFGCSNHPSHKPTKRFEEFAVHLDSAGYVSDTDRSERLEPDLTTAARYRYKENVFFIIDPEDHTILQNRQRDVSAPVDYAALEQVQCISAYYYYDKNETIVREDGVIEEWQFETPAKAEKALKELDKIRESVYFNTDSFAFQSDSCVYLFHTRAAAFDETLERFYTDFKSVILL